MERIHRAALDVLARIGMADAPPEFLSLALEKGCSLNEHGRLCFPNSLVEDLIASTPSTLVLHGREPGREVELGGDHVHYATGGQAVRMLDLETNQYRPSTLTDLYDSACLVDTLEHIQVFNRNVVATDIEDWFELDINSAYATIAGTTKPIGLGFAKATHVPDAVRMFDAVLGGEGRFRERPFATTNCCAIVSPLKYGADNSEVAMAATRLGVPVKMVVAAQAGATAPAALAGALVQSTAETLAGLALVQFVNRGAPCLFANYPFVSDLRTGAFSGGGGEEAVLNAAAAQIANFYDLPSAVAAGMTDSKQPDSQAGYEKGVTDVLAGLAGANVIYESTGMMASLLGCSLESYVIDNEMLGAVRRAIRGIEVADDTLSVDVIEETVLGLGHFLGHPQTLALMETEYVYPEIGDRTTPDEWEEAGSPTIRERAREKVRDVLARHRPEYVPREVDDWIRDRYAILLERERMRASPAREASRR
jgi:trimethylamine--corrinoid protein Co-methyltransferase